MRDTWVFLSLAFLFSACTGGSGPSAKTVALPRLDPQATSLEIQSALDAQLARGVLGPASPVDAQLDEIIAAGKRNLDWIQVISNNRIAKAAPANPPKPLSISKQEVAASSMDNPLTYSDEIIVARYRALKDVMNPAMLKVLMGQAEMTSEPPVDFDVYILFAQSLDSIYQMTLRWRLMTPYMDSLKQARANDVRGYFYLSRRPNLQAELTAFDTLAPDLQAKLRVWLKMVCYSMQQDDDFCASELQAAETRKNVFEYYDNYLPVAKLRYDLLFEIAPVYLAPTFAWDKGKPGEMTVPFQMPKDPKVAEAFKFNVEDEWHTQDWHLRINYRWKAFGSIEFQAAENPRAYPDTGRIIMDANAPLTEESVKYGLRHEFGHLLGFPDCYLEFYDPSAKAVLSYAVDPANIMCARSGHFQPQHYDRLKEAYFGKVSTP